jgi:hypothetical protein
VYLDVDSLEIAIHADVISVRAQSPYPGFITGFDVQHKCFNFTVTLNKAEVRNSAGMTLLCFKKVVWDPL